MTVNEYNLSVDLFSDNIYRFALKHLKNEMSAKDIVQETFAKVWVKHEQVDYNKAKSYLFTTAYHLIIDWIKKEKRSPDVELTKHAQSIQQHPIGLSEIIHEALDKLPEIQKSVVLLRDYEGYSYEEIAAITQLNESQVKVYIFRARKALQGFLKDLELIL